MRPRTRPATAVARAAPPVRRRAPRHGGQAGQALVELALVSSVFMLVLMGVADFARSMGVAVAMSGAARNGVAFAAQYPTPAAAAGAVATVVAQSGAPAGTVVTYTTTSVTASRSAKRSSLAVVQASYRKPTTGFWVPFTIYRKAVMPQGGPH